MCFQASVERAGKPPLIARFGGIPLKRQKKAVRVRARIEEYEARLAEPGFRQPFGNPEFDMVIREIVDDLAATVPDPTDRAGRFASALPEQGTEMWIVRHPSPTIAERQETSRARRALLDRTWPRLRAAMSRWHPVSDCHIAPVVLFTQPLLAEMITPTRGHDLLGIPRG